MRIPAGAFWLREKSAPLLQSRMLSARQFLEAPPNLEKHYLLRAELKADPARLQREFLAIAINPQENFMLRQGALRTILVHADELGVRGSREFANELVSAFAREFTSESLARISNAVREQEYRAEAHGAAFLVYLFCGAMIKLTPETSRDLVAIANEALKDTDFGEMVSRRLTNARKSPEEQ